MAYHGLSKCFPFRSALVVAENMTSIQKLKIENHLHPQILRYSPEFISIQLYNRPNADNFDNYQESLSTKDLCRQFQSVFLSFLLSQSFSQSNGKMQTHLVLIFLRFSLLDRERFREDHLV